MRDEEIPGMIAALRDQYERGEITINEVAHKMLDYDWINWIDESVALTILYM